MFYADIFTDLKEVWLPDDMRLRLNGSNLNRLYLHKLVVSF